MTTLRALADRFDASTASLHAQDWLVIAGLFGAIYLALWIAEHVLPDSIYTPREYRESDPPVKPIWMAPEFYERKALDRSELRGESRRHSDRHRQQTKGGLNGSRRIRSAFVTSGEREHSRGDPGRRNARRCGGTAPHPPGTRNRTRTDWKRAKSSQCRRRIA